VEVATLRSEEARDLGGRSFDSAREPRVDRELEETEWRRAAWEDQLVTIDERAAHEAHTRVALAQVVRAWELDARATRNIHAWLAHEERKA
jgi:hypothetical protein